MKEFQKIDDMLYEANHINHDSKQTLEIWDKIKKNKLLLEWAIKPTKDKFGYRDLVNGLSICNNILLEYNDVDKDIYNELIKLIYSNEQIARIVIDGSINGGYSFLLLSLYNHELKLTEQQKKFAEKEAMLKIGTRFYNEQKNADFEKDEYIEKTRKEYLKFIFSSLSDEQAHGVGDYDIRYHILNNPNWTISEKQKLIYDFWADDEEYDDILNRWEWEILNEMINNHIDSDYTTLIDPKDLYSCQYNDLVRIFNNQSTIKRVWNDIQFCKLIHQLRPQQYEIVKNINKKLKK